jgi:DNA repair protein RadA/Sms
MVNGGLDFRRFDQVLAVLSKHARMKMYNQDARVNVLGGARATEPAADAAMAAAIMCSYFDIQMPVDMVFIGEVDLGGVESRSDFIKDFKFLDLSAFTDYLVALMQKDLTGLVGNKNMSTIGSTACSKIALNQSFFFGVHLKSQSWQSTASRCTVHIEIEALDK